MATTTNYSWTTPDNTAYVKDGASAIRSLGSSVDSTLFTALGGAYPGLRLVKKQTIGSAVSSVIVTNAFNATYNNYLIIVDNFTPTNAGNSMQVQMRTGTTTSTTGYYGVLGFWNYVGNPGAAAGSNTSNWGAVGRTIGVSQKTSFGFNLYQPFLADRTIISSTGTTGFDITGQFSGYHDSAVSYDQVVVTSNAGTITGGTIYVYGYGIS